MARIFISYRHVQPDQDLANALHAYLRGRGLDVFLDRDIPWGANWEREIGSQIKEAGHFVVLLSEQSILSDAVREEVHRAHRQMKAGQTRILPLRFANLQELDYHLALMLNPIQYARWNPADGYQAICELVYGAIIVDNPLPEPGRTVPATVRAGGLGDAVEQGAPLPSADLRYLESETGAVPLDSAFYVETALHREIEAEFALGKGRTIVVRGPRQSGKSSQLLRAHDWALRNNFRSWLFSFQEIDDETFASLDSLLRNLARRMELAFETSLKVKDVWDPDLGAKTSFSNFVERAVLRPAGGLVALCLDEVDLVFPQPYRSDFFKILRVWHNERARANSPWRNLTMVLVHATDPSQWIRGSENSPFNVPHLRGETAGFTAEQISDLNIRYGSPLRQPELIRLFALVGGQPYLVRQALYTLKKRNLSLEALDNMATRRESPFADHLGGLRVLLDGDQQLAKTARQVVDGGLCDDEAAFQRLLMAGLVEGETRHAARMRCELYRRFLREHL